MTGGRGEFDILYTQVVSSSDEYSERYDISDTCIKHPAKNYRRKYHRSIFQNIRRRKQRYYLYTTRLSEMI